MTSGPIFLLGMMGAGKTSVGRELARLCAATFIDLDVRIERLFGASVAELFTDGEDYFRACEHTALCSLTAEPGFRAAPTVVATGGGVVTNPQNLTAMSEAGRTVYLEADVELLCARLSTPEQRRLRPLLRDPTGAGLERRLAELLRARDPAYRAAGLIVDARGTPPQVAERIFAQC